MKELDHELTNALRREDPPAGFAERVLRRVGEPPHAEHRAGTIPWGPIRLTASAPTPLSNFVEAAAVKNPDPTAPTRLPFVQWAAAAALVAAIAGGINYVAEQKERAEGEAAGVRVALALHIAGTKLQLVQTKITQLHEQPDTNSNQ
jgi:hypothetical protein